MDFKEYLLELKKYSPYDFSEYSDNSIQRRLLKVLETHNLTLDELLKKTISDAKFVEQVINDITVNTTEFFRDTDIWLEYCKEVIPTLKKKKKLTIWHAGASTGQEVYSNLFLLNHYDLLKKSTIYASDINQTVLNNAEKGTYRLGSNIKNIDNFSNLLQKIENEPINFNSKITTNIIDDSLKIDETLRKKVIFTKHDLVKDGAPNSEHVDVIFCRNVLIYFNISLQSKILKTFHDSLAPGGVLILGNHESLHGFFKARFVKQGSFYTKNNSFHFKS